MERFGTYSSEMFPFKTHSINNVCRSTKFSGKQVLPSKFYLGASKFRAWLPKVLVIAVRCWTELWAACSSQRCPCPWWDGLSKWPLKALPTQNAWGSVFWCHGEKSNALTSKTYWLISYKLEAVIQRKHLVLGEELFEGRNAKLHCSVCPVNNLWLKGMSSGGHEWREWWVLRNQCSRLL